MGPGWMKVKNFKDVRNRYTWCDFEIEINHKDLEIGATEKNT